jgi:methyl-accepting chemotaxis protein
MFKNMTIRRKIQVFTIGFILAFGVCVFASLLYQMYAVERQIAEGTKHVVEHTLKTAQESTATVARDIFRMCSAQQEAVQFQVNNDLNVARDIMQRGGGLALAQETVEWNAINQYTKAGMRVELPRMVFGDTWLGQNENMAVASPIVDATQELVGGTCTIFQRMNEAGDMLRVCTNVEKLDQTRAIGTYIPATNPDGTPNPVVSTLLNGQTFRGRAYVVNAWYITAYEPILGASGEVLGALYVGVKQENVKSLREGIMKTVVGKTGYVFVLGGSGNQRGRYVISKDGKRDGENIWMRKTQMA